MYNEKEIIEEKLIKMTNFFMNLGRKKRNSIINITLPKYLSNYKIKKIEKLDGNWNILE